MKSYAKRMATVAGLLALLAPLAMMTGCETATGSAAAGAIPGAVVGGIIGNQSGDAGTGAAIGAAAGGLAGVIAHDVKRSRQRTAQETYNDYDYEAPPATSQPPAQSARIIMENAWVTPEPVQEGNMMTLGMQYVVLGAGAGAQVTETIMLSQGGRDLGTLSQSTVNRTDGTWQSQAPIRANLQPGSYTAICRVSMLGSTSERRVDFSVTP